MLKTLFHPAFQVSMALRMSRFQDKMSNFTLLETAIATNWAGIVKNRGSLLSDLTKDLLTTPLRN